MKLSPLDIQHMEFGRTVNGYGRQQVRDFLLRIADEHDLMVREIQALRDEMRSQDEKLEDFLASEADLKRAVIAAERIGNEMKENARKEAQLIVKEAEQLKDGDSARSRAPAQEWPGRTVAARTRPDGLSRAVPRHAPRLLSVVSTICPRFVPPTRPRAAPNRRNLRNRQGPSATHRARAIPGCRGAT